jgi:hypothetical protein
MTRLGDDRTGKNVLRSIQRMTSEDSNVSGEITALLGMLERVPESRES